MSSKQKIILILMIPVFIISAWMYALFSVLNKPTADITNRWNIASGTQNLSWENVTWDDNILVNSWSIEDLTGTWDISTQTTGTTIKKIRVYMPDYYYNRWFEIIGKKLLKEKKVMVKYETFKDLESYKNTLNTEITSWSIDIFMVPTDWINSFENNWFKVDFKNDISQLFSYIFYDHIKSKKYTFIPYSIDPFVTLISKDISMGDRWFDLDKLKEISLISAEWSSASKILFNVSDLDVSLLKAWKSMYSDYFLILYNIIYQAYLSQDPNLLTTFLTQWLWIDSKKIIKLVKIFSRTTPECEFYTNICLMSNWYGDVTFGFLSYLDIWDKYFKLDKKNPQDFNVYNFIADSNIYPVRGWWFMVNKNSQNIEESLALMNEYITQWTNWNNLFWKNSLPAFNWLLSNSRIDRSYENIFKFENKFQLLNWTTDLEKNFTQKTPMLEVLKGDYSVDAFLDQLDWEF